MRGRVIGLIFIYKGDYKMKRLNMFLKFDFAKWQEGKRFVIQSVKYNASKGCVSLDVIIVEDHTDYEDLSVSNLYEKFKVHCIRDKNVNQVDKYYPHEEIEFVSIGKCSVWGDYNSNLSVEAEVQEVK